MMPAHSSDMAERAEVERFRVSAYFPMMSASGTLVVSPGSIVLKTDRATRALNET
jgi:hypothetical protein